MNIPNDPAILLSYINTKLRDGYESLDALCEDAELDRAAIEQKLAKIGCSYSAEHNAFV